MSDNLPTDAIDEAMGNIREEYDHPAVQAMMDEMDVHHLIDRMEGRGGGIRPSKPQASGDNGLIQYVWRMCRFHSGADAKMPVTATWWLEGWLEEQDGIEASVSGVKTDAEREGGDAITDALEDVVTLILLTYGRDPTGGAKRWEGLLY